MIIMDDLEVGDILQFVESEDTSEDYWNQVAVVKTLDMDVFYMTLISFNIWDMRHEIIGIHLDDTYNLIRLRKIPIC